MPNVTPVHVRVRIIGSLVEGNSVSGTGRQTHTKKRTVLRLLVTVGLGCMKLHNRMVTGIRSARLEIDETWAYVGRHERRLLKTDPRTWGDVYTMFAIDSDTKLILSYYTAKRTLGAATRFMKDLRKRVKGKPQISVDGWPHWIESMRRAFGYTGVHAAAIVKEYQRDQKPLPGMGAAAYGRVKSTEKTVIYGKPDLDLTSTAMAERANLTARMGQRRLIRSTNGYSKKKENLAAAMALHYMWYNFCRVHETTGKTPAVAAKLADHTWTIEELLLAALVEMGQPQPKPPKLYPSSYKRKRHTLAQA